VLDEGTSTGLAGSGTAAVVSSDGFDFETLFYRSDASMRSGRARVTRVLTSVVIGKVRSINVSIFTGEVLASLSNGADTA
jgi:hypothetical protein